MPAAVSNGIRRVAAQLSPDTATDGELLARFLHTRDEAAFAAIVRRHAAMVFGTCRRVLGNSSDADDAFQATFVVLLGKAHSLTDRVTVGNFLYGIAFNTALKAKAMAVKRRSKEANTKRPEPVADQEELLKALDEELSRLPEKYRGPVVLCELEGRSRREAAVSLGVPEGTLSSRLATAHRMLETRLRSRGFAGVCVATVLAGQVAVATEPLTQAALMAALEPKQHVSQLATEVTKMVLLQKIGIGGAVFAALVVGIATAFPAPPSEKPPGKYKLVAAPVPVEKEPAWKADFRKAYGLKDGEVLRRVPPPYPECRAEYFKDRLREFGKRNKLDLPAETINRDYGDHFTKFGWKDGWPDDNAIMHNVPVKPEEGISLGQVIRMTTGFTHTRFEGDAELLARKVTGDFVVRVGVDPAKVATVLEKILQKECDIAVSLAVVEVERDVYVLSGKYEAKPLPERRANLIEVYANDLQERTTGGGGSGDLHAFADHIEGFINSRIVIGKVEGAPKRVEWHFNARSPFTAEQRAQDTDADAVMKNVASQTGLTVKLEKQKINVLMVKKPG